MSAAVSKAENVLGLLGETPEGLGSKAAGIAANIILKAQVVMPKIEAYRVAHEAMGQAWAAYQDASDSVVKATLRNEFNSAKRKYSAFSKFEKMLESIQTY